MPARTERQLTRVLTEVEKAGLARAAFRDANFDCVDFVNADLRQARFENVSLIGCDFSGADLRGTEFHACDLRGSRFSGVKWGDNLFYGSIFSRSSGIGRLRAFEIQTRGGSFFPIGLAFSGRAD